MPKKNMKNQPRGTPVSYVMEITGWDWSYYFGLSGIQNSYDPYSEYKELRIDGLLLRPAKLAAQMPKVEMFLMPDIKENEQNRIEAAPLCVGSLGKEQDRFSGRLGLPADALNAVLSALIAGHLKYMVFACQKFRYGRLAVISYRLSSKFDQDDLYPDQK